MSNNLPANKKDNQLTNGTGRIPKKGGYYSVAPGKVEADAWRVQEEANDAKINTEVIEATQTNEYARAIVRAYAPDGHWVDGVVNHDFETIMQKKLMEILKKELGGGKITLKMGKNKKYIQVFQDLEQPFYLDGIKTVPNLTPMGQIKILDDMLQFKDISLRDATSKAMRIAQLKITNKEWREAPEIQAEEDEVKSVSGKEKVQKVDQETVDKKASKTKTPSKKPTQSVEDNDDVIAMNTDLPEEIIADLTEESPILKKSIELLEKKDEIVTIKGIMGQNYQQKADGHINETARKEADQVVLGLIKKS